MEESIVMVQRCSSCVFKLNSSFGLLCKHPKVENLEVKEHKLIPKELYTIPDNCPLKSSNVIFKVG